MELSSFSKFHSPALEVNDARHNLFLALLDEAVTNQPSTLRYWSMGSSGACALQNPGWPVVLGEVSEAVCSAFAEKIHQVDYPAVIGPDATAAWFVDRASFLGRNFHEPIPQQIYAIKDSPQYPGAGGAARSVEMSDASLFADWMIAFRREATPHNLIPNRETLQKAAGNGRYMFWTVGHEPVSMAGIVRQTSRCAAIGGVYTPPVFRGRGYAASITAAVIDRAMANGKSTVCLYTDMRNPFSNRCYQKVGLRPVCRSQHFPVATDNVKPP